MNISDSVNFYDPLNSKIVFYLIKDFNKYKSYHEFNNAYNIITIVLIAKT